MFNKVRLIENKHNLVDLKIKGLKLRHKERDRMY